MERADLTISAQQHRDGDALGSVLFILQRVWMEAKAPESPVLGQLLGDRTMVEPPEASLFSAMVMIQAFALEKLLKSILTAEGHNIERERKLKTHDLLTLYDALEEETKKRCQREYYTCASVARGLQIETGLDEKIEFTLRNLLARHKDEPPRVSRRVICLSQAAIAD